MPKRVVIVRKQAAPPPKSGRGCLGSVAAALGLVVSGAYLLNPGLGVFDFLPDNLPLVGNLDEVFFTILFLSCLAYFGLEIPFLSRRYGIQKTDTHADAKAPPKPVEGRDNPPQA